MPINNQNRNKQPLRAGGNSAAKPIEDHKAAFRGHDKDHATQIAIGPSAWRDIKDSSKGDNEPAKGFNFGGNCACDPSREKHNQAKAMGKKSVGGKVVGEAPIIPSEVQVSERRHGAGNNPDGGHEHQMCGGGMEKVSAKINRN